MKITTQHYDTLSSAIMQAQQGYHTLGEYQAQNLTAGRWRWDLLWRAKRLGFMPDRFLDTLYYYLNDTHVETALKRITATS